MEPSPSMYLSNLVLPPVMVCMFHRNSCGQNEVRGLSETTIHQLSCDNFAEIKHSFVTVVLSYPSLLGSCSFYIILYVFNVFFRPFSIFENDDNEVIFLQKGWNCYSGKMWLVLLFCRSHVTVNLEYPAIKVSLRLANVFPWQNKNEPLT